MFKNMMTLHLSAFAFSDSTMEAIGVLYAELKVDVPTLFFASLPKHAAATVVTLCSNGAYDVVLINSGSGIEKHETRWFVKTKGFRSAKPQNMFVPTMEFKGVTKQQLKGANYHSGPIKQVYYKDQPAVKAVKKQHIMPWELTDSQGIGSCTVSSIWYTLRFYYQALVFESDIRLSLLGQAISETVELQSRIQRVDDELDADYFKRREAAKDTPYHSETVKALWDKKDKLQNNLRMRRELIVVGLNETLMNLILLFHELDDIRTKRIFWENNKSKSKWVAKEKLRKAAARERLLVEAIPRIMASFHAFWAEQQGQCASNPMDTEAEQESRIVRCMSWSTIEHDTRTLYSDAVKLVEGKDLELVRGQLGTRSVKKNEPLNVHSLPIHESLRLLLDRIIIDGDSEALRGAIDVHLQEHSTHPRINEANYLLVLYAALVRSASLLDYLVNVKELPFEHRFRAIVPKDHLMLLSDLERERDISVFAALEFKKYGQPLDNFLQLFRLTSKPAKSVIRKFVQVHHRNIPSATEYAAALAQFAEGGKLTLLAYTIAMASEQEKQVEREVREKWEKQVFLEWQLMRAGQESQMKQEVQEVQSEQSKQVEEVRRVKGKLLEESDDTRVLNILLTDVSHHRQLEAPLLKAIVEGNTAVVGLILPQWIRVKRHSQAIRENLIVPRGWISAASRGPFPEVLRQLLPYGGQLDVDKCLPDVASRGHADVAILLAGYSSTEVPNAVIKSTEEGHLDVANALARLYPSKKLADQAFLVSAKHGNSAFLREFIGFLKSTQIDNAITTAAQHEKFETVEVLLGYASPMAIQEIVPQMIGKEAASSAFAKALTYAPASADLLTKASMYSDHKAIQALLPFVTLSGVEDALSVACERNDLGAVSLLSSLANTKAADSCFRTLVDREATWPKLLEQLVPRMSREAVFEIHSSPGKKGHLKESTCVAIDKRVEGFPTEISFEHAFRVGSKYHLSTPSVAQSEAEKYGVELPALCTEFAECAKVIESLSTSMPTAAVERALTFIGGELSNDERVKVVPLLIPIATPFVCTYLMESPSGVSTLVPEFASACAKKALKSALVKQCESAIFKEDLGTLETLIPHIPPLGIFRILELQMWRGPQLVDKIIDMLSEDQVGILLNLFVREYADVYEDKNAPLLIALLKKAPKPAIDASLLHANRHKPSSKPLLNIITGYATDEGQKAAEQLAKQLVPKW